MRAFIAFLGCIILAGCSGGTRALPVSANFPSFRYGPAIAPSSKYKSIFAFNSTDGSQPHAGLTNVKGTLYGTTYTGGSAGPFGTVFKITTTGTETVVYSFKVEPDGASPWASVTDVGGKLYGTTESGGSSGGGTVFKVTTHGAEKVLHSFTGGSDGSEPEAPLINVSGTLYGTTYSGGPDLAGTVYKITTSGTEKVIYSFKGSPKDGASPAAGLTNVKGTLYGTTLGGGSAGGGTVFKVTTSGKEKVLHVFKGSDGSGPSTSLLDVGGVLYGTTDVGGANGLGTVFKITTTGSEKVVYSFKGGSDGASPVHTGLINVKGTLYGVTAGGGTSDGGTVFKVTTSGKETVLHSFAGGSDGFNPSGVLTEVTGVLYGTTLSGGGASAAGTVYSLTP
jgi:uncharacterized repeat protein (TIGR03803 family)